MMSNESSAAGMSNSKALKANLKDKGHKNETFYVKKRGLFRKAE